MRQAQSPCPGVSAGQLARGLRAALADKPNTAHLWEADRNLMICAECMRGKEGWFLVQGFASGLGGRGCGVSGS